MASVRGCNGVTYRVSVGLSKEEANAWVGVTQKKVSVGVGHLVSELPGGSWCDSNGGYRET